MNDQLNLWPKQFSRLCLFLTALLGNLHPLHVRADEPVSFRSDVAPILRDNCIACHCARKAEGGYRLDVFAEMVKAGDSGIEPLVKSEDNGVEFLRRLTTEDKYERMPAEGEALSGEQIQIIRRWIESGADFDGADASARLSAVIPPPEHPPAPETYSTPMQVTSLAFSPDGKTVLTGGYHEVLVWNLEGTLQRRIQNIGQQTFALAFDPDGKKIAVACGQPGRDGEVRLIDFNTGNVIAVPVRCEDVVLDVAFRPDGKILAVAAADKFIYLVDMDSLEVTSTLKSHADWVTAVAWSSDGKRLVSASRDKSVKVFDSDTGQLLVSYQGHKAAVRGVSILPENSQVVSVGSDNKLHRWNIETAKKAAEVGLGGEGYKVAAGDGWVLVPTANQTLLRVDTGKTSILSTLTGHTDWVLAAGINHDQSIVGSGSYNGEVRIWNVADGSLMTSWLAKP